MKTLVVFLFALFTGDAIAQQYTFKVLISKGQNAVKAGENWQPIEVGATLQSTDEFRVAADGYIGLVHVQGRPIEIRTPGQYKVAELVSKIKPSQSALSKYIDYVLSAKEEERATFHATGAVTRGARSIKVYLPQSEKAVVMNDEVLISWTGMPAGPYIIQFNSMFGDELDRREVSDTTVTVDLSSSRLSKEDNIVIQVFLKEDRAVKSEKSILKRLSAADRGRLSGILKDSRVLVAEKTALNMYYLANLYEENSLLVDAATAYQNAIRLAPEVPDFKLAFERFVDRHNLKN